MFFFKAHKPETKNRVFRRLWVSIFRFSFKVTDSKSKFNFILSDIYHRMFILWYQENRRNEESREAQVQGGMGQVSGLKT